MKEQSTIELMNEIVEETMPALKELMDDTIKPLIEYRAGVERRISDQAIKQMYKEEQEV
jgi:hypothetical protein